MAGRGFLTTTVEETTTVATYRLEITGPVSDTGSFTKFRGGA